MFGYRCCWLICWTALFNTAGKTHERGACPVQKTFFTPLLITISVSKLVSDGVSAGFRPEYLISSEKGAASFLLHPDFLMLEASVPSGAASVPADVFLIWSYTRWRNSLSEAQRKASLTENDLIKHRSWKDERECQRCIPQERQWERKCVCVCVCVCVWPRTFYYKLLTGFAVSTSFRRAWCSWWCLEELASRSNIIYAVRLRADEAFRSCRISELPTGENSQ